MSLPSLIVTLKLEQSAQSYFQRLRVQHFPIERNFTPAHITLFHYLPAENTIQIKEDIQSACRLAPFSLHILPPKLMGSGVMFAVESAELKALHAFLKGKWGSWLKPQDLQGYRPHIVIQNKVSQEFAKTTLANLDLDDHFTNVSAEGLLLWDYLGGPWSLKDTFLFDDAKFL